MLIHNLTIILFLLVYMIGTGYVFNHYDPYYGIVAFIIGILLIIKFINNLIKNKNEKN
jgi:hypothetical protein